MEVLNQIQKPNWVPFHTLENEKRTLNEIANQVINASISVFKNLNSTEVVKDQTVYDFLVNLSNPSNKPYFDGVRQLDKPERDKKKQTEVYAVSTCTSLYTRSKEIPIGNRIKVYNAIMWADIDLHTDSGEEIEELIEKAKEIPYGGVIFRSFSGHGFVIMVQTDNTDYEMHRDYCRALERDLLEHYGIIADTSCCDAVRMRVGSYDENVLINTNPVKFAISEPIESVEGESDKDINIEPDERERFLKWLSDEFCRRASQEPEGSDRYFIGKHLGGDGYDKFFRIGQTFARLLGDDGFKYFDAICRISPKYNETEVKEYWKAFLGSANRDGNKLGLRSLLNLFETEWGIIPPKEEIIHLPMDGLIPWVRSIVESLATTFQCPPEYVSTAVFSAVSTLVGKKVHCWDGRYWNYPGMWMVIVAPPGSNKTSPVSFIFRPLRKIQSRNIEDHRQKLKQYREDGCKGDKPIEKALLMNDVTPEKRWALLQASENGMLALYDEFGSHIYNMNRYNKSGEVQDELAMWSGEDITVHRQGSDTILIEHPCLGMFGTTQPEQLPRMFNNADFQGNGYIGRVLWIWNGERDIPDFHLEHIDPETEKAWCDAVDFFHTMPTIGEVRFNDDAMDVYADFVNGLRARKRSSGCTEGEAEILGKLEIQCQRWALAVFLMELYQAHLNEDVPPDCIDGAMMEYSVRCMGYFAKTGVKVMKKISNKPQYSTKTEITQADLIRRLFKLHPDMKQKGLAELMNVSESYISGILKTTRK